MFPVYSRNSCSLLKGSSYLMIIEQIALTVELMLGSIVLAVLNLLSSLSMQLSDFQALSFLHYLVYDPIFLQWLHCLVEGLAVNFLLLFSVPLLLAPILGYISVLSQVSFVIVQQSPLSQPLFSDGRFRAGICAHQQVLLILESLVL